MRDKIHVFSSQKAKILFKELEDTGKIKDTGSTVVVTFIQHA